MGNCYCTRCRRWSGAQGATVLVVAPEHFKITKGEDLLKPYHEEGFADRYFCSNCGSNLYADGGEKYYIRAGVLQDVKLEPAWHVQVANKADWHEIGGTAPNSRSTLPTSGSDIRASRRGGFNLESCFAPTSTSLPLCFCGRPAAVTGRGRSVTDHGIEAEQSDPTRSLSHMRVSE